MSEKRAATKEVVYSDLNDWFYIDATSPSGLRWKQDCKLRGKTHKNFRAKGDVAGCKSVRYWVVYHDNKAYIVSRIIYCLAHGSIASDKLIDHIDGNKYNNRVENLRLVTHKINNRNRKKNCNNTTGTTRVVKVRIPNRVNGYNDYYRVVLILNDRKITKSFNIGRLGDTIALQEAVKFKELNSKILQEDGYTERHGNE